MNKPDTIETRGFLSAEALRYCANYKVQFSKEFERCEELSEQATTQLFGLSISDEHLHELQALAYWARCLGACQGAILLVGRGMAIEAQSLLRNAFEFLFFGVALVNDSTVFERLANQDSIERVKQAKGIIEARGASMPDSQNEALNELINELSPNNSGISVFDAAKIARAENMYQTVYRGLSLTASHGTNLTSTNHFFEANQAGKIDPVFGPSPVGIQFTLELIETCLVAGIDLLGTPFTKKGSISL